MRLKTTAEIDVIPTHTAAQRWLPNNAKRTTAPIVRAFRADDQAAARALIEEGLGEHFGFIDRDANPDLVDIAATYAKPRAAFFVAEIDGTVVGTAGVLVERGTVRMVRLGVDRKHRRTGVASALLKKAITFASAAGAREIVAHTQPEWADATRFYEAHGFTPFGRDEIDVHLRRRI
jgi:GNAT superfamily N-acetyltransferase